MELVSPASFDHDGASGCILWADPVHDVVVAFVSNRHARADPARVSATSVALTSRVSRGKNPSWDGGVLAARGPAQQELNEAPPVQTCRR